MLDSFPILSTLRDLCKIALGEDLNSFIHQAFLRLGERTNSHKLPANHDLQHALQRSLSRATQTLAWALFEPNRKPFAEILCNSNPIEILQRLTEAIQKQPLNLRPATSDYWLADLMERASNWQHFKAFRFGPDKFTHLFHPASIMNAFQNLSVKTLKVAVALKEKIEALESQMAELFESVELPLSVSLTVKRRKGMSAAGRAKIAAAQKKRWAKVKGETEKPAKKGRRKMSAAGRAKISAAAKLRWAKVKAAGKSRL